MPARCPMPGGPAARPSAARPLPGVDERPGPNAGQIARAAAAMPGPTMPAGNGEAGISRCARPDAGPMPGPCPRPAAQCCPARNPAPDAPPPGPMPDAQRRCPARPLCCLCVEPARAIIVIINKLINGKCRELIIKPAKRTQINANMPMRTINSLACRKQCSWNAYSHYAKCPNNAQRTSPHIIITQCGNIKWKLKRKLAINKLLDWPA